MKMILTVGLSQLFMVGIQLYVDFCVPAGNMYVHPLVATIRSTSHYIGCDAFLAPCNTEKSLCVLHWNTLQHKWKRGQFILTA